MTENSDIIYTKVDEAPELASGSLLPVIQAFTKPAGISLGVRDISLAARILSLFPGHLETGQKQTDDLAALSQIVKQPEANVIKLPNISASVPQLVAAIKELQSQGYAVPDYPEMPATDEEKSIRAAYDKVKGSAVNPVLREGNSDRRAPKAVKEYAKKNPHSMGDWQPDSKTEITSMSKGDFFANEKSVTITSATAGDAKIEFVSSDGPVTVLKLATLLEAGEVVDASFMSVKALQQFLKEQLSKAKSDGVLFSFHMKATMMKISDPVIFGHAVSAYLAGVFDRHSAILEKIGANANNGLGDLLVRVSKLPEVERDIVKKDIEATMVAGPDLFMVDSDRGISNLHVPSDVIIDASMPAVIRAGGKAWGPDGKQHDTLCVIPDRCYAPVYAETVNFCKANGAFDPATMGSVPNVGLMAQKAEEYGSHPQTFVAPGSGIIRVLDAKGHTLLSHDVEMGDIWRMSMVKDAAIRDWVKLAVNRARLAATPAVFWLNKERAHDAELITKVTQYLNDHDTDGLDIRIMDPGSATKFSLDRIGKGEDTISVTGNVLRDYLTDLFPILELGTSAKMLSIVPLMNGGGLFETGAGGSAPKLVQQMLEEGHLRWDSLGEFCALGASLEHLYQVNGNAQARILSETLDVAIEKLLDEGKSPKRRAGELDNRGSHYYLALYWAGALAIQNENTVLKAHFSPLAKQLAENEEKIVAEIAAAEGRAVDIGGYYHPDPVKVAAVMRPSETFNSIVGL